MSANADAEKYAHPERERRFVLSEMPAGATNPREIVDRYLIGTRMRLRSVSSAAEGIVYKLGHKVRPDPSDPGLVMHTSFYLSRDEYDVLSALPGHELRKTRFRVALADGAISVDEFHGDLVGLVLAEVDLAAPSAPKGQFVPPPASLAEVSADERFTGGQLAGTDRATLARLLEAARGQPPERPE